MNIIQTLWCGGRKLTESPFWWNHAEYNLMSWALSCMSLKEQFGKVTLYTDSEGAKTLIDTLKLPYTEVVVNFDGFDCLTCHWALAKVRAYSLQTEPFLHIDGDIYLTQPLPPIIAEAGLIAQNKERCTEYYRGMISRFLSVDGLKLAPQFAETLKSDNVPSYNLGFCGGNDLDFFGRFCGEVEKFFWDNDFNGEKFRNADISANVIYEQMFFSIMARDEGTDIATIHPETIRDNGYRADEFCDLMHYGQRQFIHILGGHKRTQRTCRMVERTLLQKYPELYERIAALFPTRHKRLAGMGITDGAHSGVDRYDTFIKEKNTEWDALSKKDLMSIGRAVCGSATFLNTSQGKREKQMIAPNPYLAIFHANADESAALAARLKYQYTGGEMPVAIVPDLSEKGFHETALNNLSENMLGIAKHPKSFSEFMRETVPCFEGIDSKTAEKCVEAEIGRLLNEGVLIVCGNGFPMPQTEAA